jgi:hypothetical protein
MQDNPGERRYAEVCETLAVVTNIGGSIKN